VRSTSTAQQPNDRQSSIKSTNAFCDQRALIHGFQKRQVYDRKTAFAFWISPLMNALSTITFFGRAREDKEENDGDEEEIKERAPPGQFCGK
jgi:hypothetical protein